MTFKNLKNYSLKELNTELKKCDLIAYKGHTEYFVAFCAEGMYLYDNLPDAIDKAISTYGGIKAYETKNDALDSDMQFRGATIYGSKFEQDGENYMETRSFIDVGKSNIHDIIDTASGNYWYAVMGDNGYGIVSDRNVAIDFYKYLTNYGVNVCADEQEAKKFVFEYFIEPMAMDETWTFDMPRSIKYVSSESLWLNDALIEEKISPQELPATLKYFLWNG